MSHIHKICGIESSSKEDAVYITCICGFSEIVGVWSNNLYPHHWSKRQWKKIYPSLVSLLQVFNLELGIKN